MTNTQQEETIDIIAKIAAENLNLSPKKAATFAKQARALQQNIALRKKQKQNREARAQSNDNSSR